MHIYPIRNSRNYWNIPLYCCHECGLQCQTKFTITDDGNIDIVPNPLYNLITKRCNKYETLRPATIPIHSFDLQYPEGLEGRLYYPDLIVIPDLSFSIFITFPLTTNIEVTINCEKEITLRELIFMIKSIYIQIYEDEEKTADSTMFTITQNCECKQISLKNEIEKYIILNSSLNQDCSICYMSLGERDTVKLSCNHYFHRDCIVGWIEKGNGLSCPLCRNAIYSCQLCNGSQSITSYEEYVVLPVHLREISMNRNTTNGLYGIYNHDLENLYITSMKYNRIMKILQVNVNT